MIEKFYDLNKKEIVALLQNFMEKDFYPRFPELKNNISVVATGSVATENYDKYSDVDLAIIFQSPEEAKNETAASATKSGLNASNQSNSTNDSVNEDPEYQKLFNEQEATGNKDVIFTENGPELVKATASGTVSTSIPSSPTASAPVVSPSVATASTATSSNSATPTPEIFDIIGKPSGLPGIISKVTFTIKDSESSKWNIVIGETDYGRTPCDSRSGTNDGNISSDKKSVSFDLESDISDCGTKGKYEYRFIVYADPITTDGKRDTTRKQITKSYNITNTLT